MQATAADAVAAQGTRARSATYRLLATHIHTALRMVQLLIWMQTMRMVVCAIAIMDSAVTIVLWPNVHAGMEFQTRIAQLWTSTLAIVAMTVSPEPRTDNAKQIACAQMDWELQRLAIASQTQSVWVATMDTF